MGWERKSENQWHKTDVKPQYVWHGGFRFKCMFGFFPVSKEQKMICMAKHFIVSNVLQC